MTARNVHPDPFQRLESEVRSYCRSFPVVFASARGARLFDEGGRSYIDFFAGAGALNYGHNDPDLKRALVDYLTSDGIVHSLDMSTVAKRAFLERFEEVVLRPRKLDYKLMFPGPTGTNAVEAALKVVRKATGRTRVVAFTNGFHGMTLGALSLTGNRAKRSGGGISLQGVTVLPFDGYLGDDVDTLPLIERMVTDRSSGLDLPAAFVIETVQAEGGVRVASTRWLRGLAALAKRTGVLLVVDDIQVGCGRTGPFFSFEAAGITPDLVCLSKSLSGYGLPMSTVLIRPELDVLAPGEHNGTFRGHMPAFVTATRALDRWTDRALQDKVAADAGHVTARLQRALDRAGVEGRVVGRGLIQGVAFADRGLAVRLARAAFERGLVIETAGAEDEVLKILPPLTIDRETLDAGLDVIDAVVGVPRKPVGSRPNLEERA